MTPAISLSEASVDDAAVAPFQYEAQNLEVPVVIVTSEVPSWEKCWEKWRTNLLLSQMGYLV